MDPREANLIRLQKMLEKSEKDLLKTNEQKEQQDLELKRIELYLTNIELKLDLSKICYKRKEKISKEVDKIKKNRVFMSGDEYVKRLKECRSELLKINASYVNLDTINRNQNEIMNMVNKIIN